MPGGWELIAILAVVVVLFGAKKLPGAARSVGQSMRIFKAETKGMHADGEANPGQPYVPPTPVALPTPVPSPAPAAQSRPLAQQHPVPHDPDYR